MRLVGPVGGAVLAPAAIVTLMREQPVDGAADLRLGGIDAGGVEAAERRPCAVDVVGAPAAEPAAFRLLLVAQEGETALHALMVLVIAELRQHAEAARGDVRGRRV